MGHPADNSPSTSSLTLATSSTSTLTSAVSTFSLVDDPASNSVLKIENFKNSSSSPLPSGQPEKLTDPSSWVTTPSQEIHVGSSPHSSSSSFTRPASVSSPTPLMTSDAGSSSSSSSSSTSTSSSPSLPSSTHDPLLFTHSPLTLLCEYASSTSTAGTS
ncbi:hypothetical protein HMI55_003784, partial [Coelomomyces lativittatus]